MSDIVRAEGQWMNNKTIVEYADTPAILMAAIEERRDPTHNLADKDYLDTRHAFNLDPEFTGLHRGSTEEVYNQLWGMFQAGTDKTQVVSEVHSSANNFHNTMGALTIGFIEEPATSGTRIDPNKVVKGDPQCFIRSVPIDVGFPVIKIAIDCGILGNVMTETIVDRGRLIAEAIVRAELGGYKTRITACSATHMYNDSKIVVMALNLKREDEPINYSRVLYPILEPSFLRGVSFSWRATLPELHDSQTPGMGRSIYADYTAAQRAELYEDVFDADTLVFNIGAMCAEMSHDEAKEYIENQFQSREASRIDGSMRGQISYAQAADIGGVVNMLMSMAGVDPNAEEDDEWDDEEDDPDYKIIG